MPRPDWIVRQLRSWTVRSGGPGPACLGPLAALLAVLAFAPALAAPAIERDPFTSPAEGHIGEPIMLFASGLVAPVRVFFSDGANPVVEATPAQFDAARGAVLTHVPAGAATGNMKISANGVDSPLFHFRVLAGAFVQGTDTVGGQATNGAAAVAGVLVALIRDTGCPQQVVQDYGVTDATGHYTLHGVDGSYELYALPAAGSGLAGLDPSLSLSTSPATLNLPLVAGTSVTGRVVDATNQSIGIAGARLTFDGPAQDAVLADGSGNFAVRLVAGSWKVEVHGPGHAFNKINGTVSGTSLSLGNVTLATGVKVSGALTRLSDGTPFAGVEINAFGPDLCCGKFDRTFSAGDGSFALFIPSNQTVDLAAFFDPQVTVADVFSGNQAVGTSNVVVNLQAREAAFIDGTATDLGTLAGIRNLEVLASSGGQLAAAFTCIDGSYHLRVVPGAAGYIALSNASDPAGPTYAYQYWNGTPAGTYFPCEAVPVPAPSAGGTTGGIAFKLPRAASVQGLVSSEAGGCGNDLGTAGVVIDDGGSHGCGMGVVDPSLPPPGYRIALLPSSGAVAQLRACAVVAGYDPQCWSLQTPPAYDPIVVAGGGTASSIDFCLSTCVAGLTWYRDADGDGHGAASSTATSCAQPAGYVLAGDDCDDANPQVWETPGEARSLLFTNAQTFSWAPPASLGGLAVVYDALRSADPANFVGAATCVESNDGSNTTATDASAPAVGTGFFYLVRAENTCPSGQGLLGTNSSGTPIAGRSCP
jgi:hypothetical protein